jgi:hypothetical protein
MSNPSDETAGRGVPNRDADTGTGADPSPLDTRTGDADEEASAPANVTPGVGAVGGATAPVGGLTGVVGGARGAADSGENDQTDAGDPEREAFRSGEDEFGASAGPAGGTARP